MSFSSDGRFRQQERFLRQQFAQEGELPFMDVLSEMAAFECVDDAIGDLGTNLIVFGHSLSP